MIFGKNPQFKVRTSSEKLKIPVLIMDSKTNFPIECFEDICHHLPAKQLRKCTLVCPKWKEVVGTTRSFAEKIKFSGTFDLNDDVLLENLMNSKRKYEKVKLEGNNREGYQMLSLERKTLTLITNNDLDFGTVDRVLDFLWVFQASTEKLVLRLGKAESNDKITDVLGDTKIS